VVQAATNRDDKNIIAKRTNNRFINFGGGEHPLLVGGGNRPPPFRNCARSSYGRCFNVVLIVKS
jgi:hypothetical protein